jgi:cell division protein FtsL
MKKFFSLIVNWISQKLESKSQKKIGEKLAQIMLVLIFLVWAFSILVKKEKFFENFILI